MRLGNFKMTARTKWLILKISGKIITTLSTGRILWRSGKVKIGFQVCATWGTLEFPAKHFTAGYENTFKNKHWLRSLCYWTHKLLVSLYVFFVGAWRWYYRFQQLQSRRIVVDVVATCFNQQRQISHPLSPRSAPRLFVRLPVAAAWAYRIK